LGPSVIAVIAALVAGYIALRQWQTAHYRLRLDMYDKRFVVYEAVKSLASTIGLHGQVTIDDLGEFYHGVRGAEFLFDGDTRDFVEKIGIMAFKARMMRASLDKQPDHPREAKLSDEEEDILDFIRNQSEHLEPLFRRYLDLSKAGLLSKLGLF